MPTYEKSEEWLAQSSLLIQARPATTRVTTRYSLNPARRPPSKAKLAAAAADTDTDSKTTTTPRPPRGELVLKTYDPVSGATLKYRTCKAAEVSRLVQMLGGLGRRMAGKGGDEEGGNAGEGEDEDEVMGDAPDVAPTAAGKSAGGQQQQQPQQGGGGGGGKGKKKKGKR